MHDDTLEVGPPLVTFVSSFFFCDFVCFAVFKRLQRSVACGRDLMHEHVPGFDRAVALLATSRVRGGHEPFRPGVENLPRRTKEYGS